MSSRSVRPQNSLRAIGDKNVGLLGVRIREGEFRPQLAQQDCGAFGGPHRRRRLDDDQIAALEHRGNRFERCFHRGDIGFVIVGHRRRHRDDKRVRRFRRRDGTKLAGFYGRAEHHIEIRLNDMSAA